MGADVEPTLVEAGATHAYRRTTFARATCETLAELTLSAPAVASKLAGRGECVVAVEDLAALRRQHAISEDCWYSCPLAVDEDGEDACCDHEAVLAGRCTCGADEHNARIDALLGDGESGGDR